MVQLHGFLGRIPLASRTASSPLQASLVFIIKSCLMMLVTAPVCAFPAVVAEVLFEVTVVVEGAGGLTDSFCKA